MRYISYIYWVNCFIAGNLFGMGLMQLVTRHYSWAIIDFAIVIMNLSAIWLKIKLTPNL